MFLAVIFAAFVRRRIVMSSPSRGRRSPSRRASVFSGDHQRPVAPLALMEESQIKLLCFCFFVYFSFFSSHVRRLNASSQLEGLVNSDPASEEKKTKQKDKEKHTLMSQKENLNKKKKSNGVVSWLRVGYSESESVTCLCGESSFSAACRRLMK